MDKTYKDKNEMYIDVGGVQYFVLGVIGYESKTVWDQMIFLNGLASSSLIDKQIYTLDFFSGDSQQVMGAIVEALFVKHHIEARILSANRSFLFSLLPRVLSARWFAAILLCMIASIILLSMEWVRRKKIVWSVKQMVGASRIRIVFELYLQYSSMLLLSLCGSSIYCTAIYPAYFNFLYTGYLLFMPFFLFFLVGSTIYLLSIPIREGLY